MLDIISVGIIPAIVIIIILHGFIKGVDIYDAFLEGALEGIKTAVKIMPSLIAIFIAIGIFRASNAMDMFLSLVSPIAEWFKIPKEILPLVFIRPLSGSGALGTVKDIISHYGPDSIPGILASVMMGSSETIFYTITVYFGSIAIKDHGYTLKAAMISYVISVFIAIFVCSIVYGW